MKTHKSKKILVIDDDESILEAVRLVLVEEDYVVKTSNTYDNLTSLIKSFKPDVILLDILLSGEDGRDICKNLKTNTKTKSIPIILFSAHPSAIERKTPILQTDFFQNLLTEKIF